MEYLLIALSCYVIGMINPTLLIGFFKRVNVRKTGSRNPGTSNAAMTFGLRYGIFVGIIDILKGAMPVVVLRVMFPEQDLMHVLGGFFAIIGHIFPVVLKFKGGKGTATFGGVCFALFPVVSAVLFVLFFIVLIVSDYIVVPTILSVVFIPIGMWFTNFSRISIGIIAIYSLISIYKHLPNIIRLFKHEEVGLRKGLSKKE